MDANALQHNMHDALLPLLILLPLLGGLAVALLPAERPASTRAFALLNTTMTFVVSLIAASPGIFQWHETGFQLESHVPWIDAFGLHFRFGVDTIAMWLVLLTTFLMPLVILGASRSIRQRHREFFLWLLILQAAMLGTFVARDLIFFYICFEFTLVPLYFLIGIFGSTQRSKAARVFFLYTFTGSMLTFVGVLYIACRQAEVGVEGLTFSLDRLTESLALVPMSLTEQRWILLALLAGFAVKIPLFPVHTWLPLAHTEAPTAGSVILAGVLLKLGMYGLLRFALPMCPDALVEAAPIIGTLAVIGILYTALICWVQKDMKKLIAYSSISHLGFCVLGMLALNPAGLGGSLFYMINHGLSTGALFLCVGMIYERFHTRRMNQLQGLARSMPRWAFFMVFFSFASVGLPGLNGFVGEFLTLLGTFQATDILGHGYAIAAATGMILAAIYMLTMVGRVVFGPPKVPEGCTPVDLDRGEMASLLPLAVACLFFGLFPNTILSTVQKPLDTIAAPARTALVARKAAPSAAVRVAHRDHTAIVRPD